VTAVAGTTQEQTARVVPADMAGTTTWGAPGGDAAPTVVGMVAAEAATGETAATEESTPVGPAIQSFSYRAVAPGFRPQLEAVADTAEVAVADW